MHFAEKILLMHPLTFREDYQASVRALARRYSISPTTVQKWRKRETVTDKPMGPTDPHSSVLSIDEEEVIVTFRRHSLLPLDDCLYALQPAIPHPLPGR